MLNMWLFIIIVELYLSIKYRPRLKNAVPPPYMRCHPLCHPTSKTIETPLMVYNILTFSSGSTAASNIGLSITD